MTRRLKFKVLAAIAVPWLAGCASATPPTQADEAVLNTCTANADAGYNMSNMDALSRTSQNGLYFAPTPNHVFDSQRMGSLNQRNNQINDCMQNGTGNSAGVPAAPLVKPQIIGPQP